MDHLESRIAGWVAEAAPSSRDDAFCSAVIRAAERRTFLSAVVRRIALTLGGTVLLGLLLTIARQQDFTALTGGPLPVAALMVGALLLRALFGRAAAAPPAGSATAALR